MREHDAHIAIMGSEAAGACRVAAGVLLRDVAERIDLTQVRCLFVEDEAGHLMGIVEAAEVVRRLASRNETEHQRWAESPIEAIVTVRLSGNGSGTAIERDPDGNCTLAGTAVTQNEQLVAVSVEDDVLIRWSSVREVLQRALFDPVTGLPNRSVFDRRLREEWDRTRQRQTSISVMMIDLDHFKDINDIHGHSMGDKVLSDVAECLANQLRSYDLLARYGGDEFAAILTDCYMSDIHIPVKRIQSGILRLSEDYKLDTTRLTVSVGAITCPGSLNVAATYLMDAADECMYAAKRAGRGCAYTMDIALAGEKGKPRRLTESAIPPQGRAGRVPRRPR